MTGVEGYVESASSGIVAGIAAARKILGKDEINFPITTATGALSHYISEFNGADFQPMNINFGLLPAMPERIRGKRERYTALANRALEQLETVIPCLQEDLHE